MPTQNDTMGSCDYNDGKIQEFVVQRSGFARPVVIIASNSEGRLQPALERVISLMDPSDRVIVLGSKAFLGDLCAKRKPGPELIGYDISHGFRDALEPALFSRGDWILVDNLANLTNDDLFVMTRLFGSVGVLATTVGIGAAGVKERLNLVMTGAKSELSPAMTFALSASNADPPQFLEEALILDV